MSFNGQHRGGCASRSKHGEGTLHQGPIKDAKRVAEKNQRKLELSQQQVQQPDAAGSDPEKNRQKMLNKSEHQLQQELRKKYESIQPLSGEIVTKGGEAVNNSK